MYGIWFANSIAQKVFLIKVQLVKSFIKKSCKIFFEEK
jgi:hypothetical protein